MTLHELAMARADMLHYIDTMFDVLFYENINDETLKKLAPRYKALERMELLVYLGYKDLSKLKERFDILCRQVFDAQKQ